MLDKRNVYRDKLPDAAVDEVWRRFRDAPTSLPRS
jgi:hypothetical protein